MNETKVINRVIKFVKKELQNSEGGHDWFHIERVYKNALLIAVLTLVGCDGGNSQAESMISQEPAHDESERDHGEEPHADDDQEDDTNSNL